MSIQNLKKIELEITSDCNAACPGCARTLNLDKLTIQNFNFEKIKQIVNKKASKELPKEILDLWNSIDFKTLKE